MNRFWEVQRSRAQPPQAEHLIGSVRLLSAKYLPASERARHEAPLLFCHVLISILKLLLHGLSYCENSTKNREIIVRNAGKTQVSDREKKIAEDLQYVVGGHADHGGDKSLEETSNLRKSKQWWEMNQKVVSESLISSNHDSNHS